MRNVCITIVVLALMAGAASAAAIQINFGPELGTASNAEATAQTGALVFAVPAGWNNFTTVNVDNGDPTMVLTNMPDSAGDPTTVGLIQLGGLKTVSDWRGSPVTTTGLPAEVTSSYSYGGIGSLLLTGLNPALAVEISFFSSRQADPNVTTPTRNTLFTATGLTTDSVEQNSYGNVDFINTITVTPTAAGEITIAAVPGAPDPVSPNNYRPYINAMMLNVVPEPATMSLLVIGGIGALLRRKR